MLLLAYMVLVVIFLSIPDNKVTQFMRTLFTKEMKK